MTISQRNILPACLALILGAVAAAPAGAQTKPAEIRTIGPAVTLSDEQMKAIAAKGVPAPMRAEPALRPLAAWKPKIVAGPSATRAPLIASVATSSPASAPALKTTQVLPLKRGQSRPQVAASRPIAPGQLDPFVIKPDEIAVIGGQKVHIPHAAVIPAAASKTP